MIQQVLEKFNIHTIDLSKVEISFSSCVYKCILASGIHVYVEIPYSTLKY